MGQAEKVLTQIKIDDAKQVLDLQNPNDQNKAELCGVDTHPALAETLEGLRALSTPVRERSFHFHSTAFHLFIPSVLPGFKTGQID